MGFFDDVSATLNNLNDINTNANNLSDTDILDQNPFDDAGSNAGENYPERYFEHMPTSMNILNFAGVLSTEIAVLSQLAKYLTSPPSNILDDFLRASNLQSIKSRIDSAYGDITSLGEIFDFDMSSFTMETALDGAIDVTYMAESILDTIDGIADIAEDALAFVEDAIEFGANLAENIESYIEDIGNLLNSLGDFNLSNLLSNLPSSIIDSLMNLSIIQQPLLILEGIQQTITNLSLTLSSIRAPSSMEGVRAVIAAIRGLLEQLKSLQAQVERVKQYIEQISELISNGDVTTYAAILASAAMGLTFFEIPPDYGTEYPNNRGYKTHGGFELELDNTKQKERLRIKHPSGTEARINPNGDLTLKGKHDVQLAVEANGDIIIKKALNINVQGKTTIVTASADINSSGTTTVTSSGPMNVTSLDQLTLSSKGPAVITSNASCTLMGTTGLEISSPGITTISGSTVNLVGADAVNIVSGTFNTKTGSQMHIAGKYDVIGSSYTVKAATINLN